MSCPRPSWLVDRRSGTHSRAAGSDLLARLCDAHLGLGLHCFFLLLVGGSQSEKELQPTSGWGLGLLLLAQSVTPWHAGAEKGKTGTKTMEGKVWEPSVSCLVWRWGGSVGEGVTGTAYRFLRGRAREGGRSRGKNGTCSWMPSAGRVPSHKRCFQDRTLQGCPAAPPAPTSGVVSREAALCGGSHTQLGSHKA